MCHATLPWAGRSDRRTLFYKFCPMNLALIALPYDVGDYDNLTDRQRTILAPPGGTANVARARNVLRHRELSRSRL